MPEWPRDNPFSGIIVADARQQLDADVPGINLKSFEACMWAAQQAHQRRESASVFLYGVPGSGKTHLLARLRAHLEHACSQQNENLSVVVSVKLNAAPRRLWRHVREQLSLDLRREIFGQTILDRLIAVRLSTMDPERSTPELWFQWLKQPQKDVNGVHEFLDETVRDRNLRIVLTHLFLGQHKLDARAWLRGDSLPEDVLARLGIASSDSDDDLDPESSAQKVVQALCQLGAPAPFVFCFDQIEALQTDTNDLSGLFAFGRMAAELHDGSPNVALISCVQSAFRDTIRQAIREADRHRIEKLSTILELLQWPQARALVIKRLEMQPVLAEAREKHGELWPLQERDLIALVEPNGCTARTLITRCAELYEHARSSAFASVPAPAITVQSVDEFLESTWSQRFEEALRTGTPNDADDILETGLPLAFRIFSPSLLRNENERDADLSMTFDGAAGRVAFSLCNQANMNSLASRLRRLNDSVQAGRFKGLKLVLIRQSPISPAAKKSREYLKALSENGASLVQPSAEALAALAVLRDILAEAQSGDLSHGSETLKAETIRQWLARHPPPSVKDLIDGLLSPVPEPDLSLKQDLLAWLNKWHVARLDEAAAALKQDSATVRACVLGNQTLFGLLEGPPSVIYQRSTDTVAVEE